MSDHENEEAEGEELGEKLDEVWGTMLKEQQTTTNFVKNS